jgi:hypothetical protein
VVIQSASAAVTAAPRAAVRHRVAVPARLTWKDSSGAVRFASVTTRDLSDTGAFVECGAQAPIPLYRLVHLQLERAVPQAPTALQNARMLAAVWRVESQKARAGAPSGYALRFLVEPSRTAGAAGDDAVSDAQRFAPAAMAVAS